MKKKVISLWVIAIIIVVLVLVFGSRFFKSKYDCSENDEKCHALMNDAMNNCKEAIFISDTTNMTMSLDITRPIPFIDNDCHITWRVENSLFNEYKGLSMVCNVPMTKLDSIGFGKTKASLQEAQQSFLEFLKYCEGSFKDMIIKDLNITPTPFIS